MQSVGPGRTIPAGAPFTHSAPGTPKFVGPKKGFLIYGDDRVGVVAELLEKLTQAKINVTATQAVIAGADRFGMILWVKSPDVRRASKVRRPNTSPTARKTIGMASPEVDTPGFLG